MALNSDIAYKFGCGRYIQEENAIEKNLYRELKNFGKKVLFVAGDNGYKVAFEFVQKALVNTDIEYEVIMFRSVPCFEKAEEIVQIVKEKGFEIVCGIGGGVIGDIAKLVAEIADIYLFQIPTSSATCVAATPLSITYDPETRVFRGSFICKKEASAVIVDTAILIAQPPRLFWSGIVDSRAKMVEIQHFFLDGKEVPVGLEMAYSLSKEIDRFYEENMEEMEKALAEKKITKTFELALFYSIAVTGIISGLSKNSSQTALGHAFYYEIRTNYCKEARYFLHGELVGIGLIVQLAYNRMDYQAMIDLLRRMNLPATLSEIGITPTEENASRFVDKFFNGEFVVDKTEENRKEMIKAVALIAK